MGGCHAAQLSARTRVGGGEAEFSHVVSHQTARGRRWDRRTGRGWAAANASRTNPVLESQIVALRKELDELGHDSAAQTYRLPPRATAQGDAVGLDDLRVLTREVPSSSSPTSVSRASLVRFEADRPIER